jgi:hypothetical protein
VYEILHSVKHIRERVFTQATETRIYHQYILKARDPNLRGRWKENRKPGEYEEPGVDCFVRQQCGVCAAEYPTKVVNAAAAAELEPGEVSDTTSSDEEAAEEAVEQALEDNPFLF